MNRHYTKEEYLEKVDLIKKYFPFASITTDLIVGFPTETEEDLMESIDTIKKAKFFMVHCFPYSKREGTKASLMPQVLNSVKKQREKKVLEVVKEISNEYLEMLIKNKVCQNILIEEEVTILGEKYFVGHSEYFVKCYLKFDDNYKINDIVTCDNFTIFEDGVKC